MKRILLIIVLTIPFCLNAQSIEGIIVDKLGNPVNSATVILQDKDSTYVTATVTDSDGLFTFNRTVYPFQLIIQHISFKLKRIEGVKPEKFNITLEDNEDILEAASVKASFPYIKIQENGALAYDIVELRKNRPVNSALDLLEEIPSIEKNNGRYSIVGTSVTSIILNGRRVNMSAEQIMTLLSTTPPSNVKSIEVFYNTPPQYGVKGGSLNIVLNKPRTDDVQFQGSIFGSLSKSHHYRSSGGINLTISDKNWSVDLAYSITEAKQITDLELATKHTIKDDVFDISFKNSIHPDNRDHFISANLSYEYKNKDQLSLFYSGKFNHFEQSSHSDFILNGVENIESSNNQQGDGNLHIVNSEYRHNSWVTGGDFTHYEKRVDQRLINHQGDKETSSVSESQQIVNRLNLYTNNSNKFGTGTLYYGMDFMYSHTNNSQYFISDDLQDNDDFETKQIEKNLDLFIGWRQRIKQGTIDLSLSSQYAISEVESKGGREKLWNNFYLFPSLTFSKIIKQGRTLQIALSSSKDYPGYNQTTPMRYYMNSYCLVEGNPSLKPSLTYQLNTNFIINNRFIIGLFGTINPNRIMQMLYQDENELTAIYKYINLQQNNRIGLMGVVPVKWNNVFNSRFVANFFWIHQQGKIEDISFNRGVISGRITLTNNVILNNNKNLALQVGGWYQLPVIQGIYDLKNLFNVFTSLTWSPQKGRWNIVLKADDIFNTDQRRIRVLIGSQNYSMNIFPDSRTVSLSVRYTFGGYKAKESKKIDVSRMGL